MSDRKITLFEFHFDGPLRIGPSFGEDPSPDLEATDGGGTSPDVSDESVDAIEDAASEETAGSGAPVKGALVGLLLIVALAVAARVLLGEDDADEVDDVEMVDLDHADESAE
jgi:hypothetical protein